jgi:DNA-binding winged helix-turn-helix (wHTH) protein
MKNSAHETQAGEGHQEGLLHLTIEGLIPANHELVLNLAERSATLFYNAPEGKVSMVEQKRFSPNGMRVLVPLLQAYPKYCVHEVLFASLFSLPLDEAYQQMREMRPLTIRSVRRAISSLHTRLRAFGWQVRSIRSAGYLIEAIPAEKA